MEPATASTIGTIVGSAIAAFVAQAWGNRKTEKKGEEVKKATAAQSTSNDILARVKELETKVEVLVKQPGVIQTKDDRSPDRKD